MKQMILIIFFTTAVMTKISTSTRKMKSEDEIEGVDKTCPRNIPCMPHTSCPPAMDLFKTLGMMDRGSKEYLKQANIIKELVCNKKEKAVCCVVEPVEEEDCMWRRKGYTNGEQVQDLFSWWFEVRCWQGRRVVQGRQWGEVVRDSRFQTP